MKKNAIIDMIESDLQELQTLIETFREPERIAKDFIALLEEKHSGIGREIQLLNYWASESLPSTSDKMPELVAEVKSPTIKETPQEAPRSQVEVPEDRIAPLVIEESNDGLFDYEKEVATETPEQAVCTATAAQPKQEVPEHAETKRIDAERIPAPQPTPVTEQETILKAKVEQPKLVEREVSSAVAKRDAAAIANYGTPVADLNKAIGINDRFLYLRELFGGNNKTMEAVIGTINSCSNYEEAHACIAKNFQWDETDPTVEAFLKAVHRRFL